jgi:ComF family protein
MTAFAHSAAGLIRTATCQPKTMNLVYNWLDIIQNTLLPPTCILCGNSGYNAQDICGACLGRLPKNRDCCYRCAESFPAPTAIPTLCGRCLGELPAFDASHAPYQHQDEIRYLVTGLKFGAQFKNARLLGRLLAESVDIAAGKPDCIIPVPLHKARYHERGFNQAVEIARTVSTVLQIPIDFTSCVRHKDTPHQTGLSAKKRRKNLRRAFSLRRTVQADHVVILDDVMTTGSTVNALATVLKKNGIGRVDVWVCARA